MFIYIDKYRNELKYDLGNEENHKNIDLKYYDDLIKEFRSNSRRQKINYMIFYSPSLIEIKNKDHYNFKNYFDSFENFYDLSEIPIQNKKKFYFDNVHLNKYGHSVYSKYMARKILLLLEG